MNEEAPPLCPYFGKGHCSGIKTGSCPLNHTAKTCWTLGCNSSACEKRHPRKCQLFFGKHKGCPRFTNCSHRHDPPPPSHTVLWAQPVAKDTQPDLVVQISELRREVSRLECKLGNMRKNTNVDLENVNIKINGKTHSQTNWIIRLEKRLEALEAVSIQEDLDIPPDRADDPRIDVLRRGIATHHEHMSALHHRLDAQEVSTGNLLKQHCKN